jgi:hypothetical protein
VGQLLGGSAILLLVLFAPTGAEEPPKLAAAPKGFDARRDGIDRGKVDTGARTAGSSRSARIEARPSPSPPRTGN